MRTLPSLAPFGVLPPRHPPGMDPTRSYASYRVGERPSPDRSADPRRTKSLIRSEAAIHRFRATPCSEGVDAASQSACAANRFSSSSISGASSVSMRFGDIPIHQRGNCRADSRRANENLSDTKALNCPWGEERTRPVESGAGMSTPTEQSGALGERRVAWEPVGLMPNSGVAELKCRMLQTHHSMEPSGD